VDAVDAVVDGCGRGRGHSQETDRNVSSTEIVEYDADQNDDATDTTRVEFTDRGGGAETAAALDAALMETREAALDSLGHWIC
jgi:hypothetical protein